MSGSRLTAIVLTLNEEEHIADCLATVRRVANDILILDSGSTDRTVPIAQQLDARIARREFDGYASQRNAALTMTSESDWVFFIDADERVSPSLAGEIHGKLKSTADEIAGFWVPRRNIISGRVLAGGGWWPDYQARFLRPERVRYDEAREVHETVIFDGESLKLRSPLLHLNYRSWRQFIAKQRTYSELRMRQYPLNQPLPQKRAYLGAPAREFWRRFVTLGGYRDGATGFFLASVLASEEVRFCWGLRRRPG